MYTVYGHCSTIHTYYTVLITTGRPHWSRYTELNLQRRRRPINIVELSGEKVSETIHHSANWAHKTRAVYVHWGLRSKCITFLKGATLRASGGQSLFHQNLTKKCSVRLKMHQIHFRPWTADKISRGLNLMT